VEPWRRAIGRIPTGVCILTTTARTGRHGMTCGTFAVVSFDPPVVLASIRNQSLTLSLLPIGAGFAANVLGAVHLGVARAFADPARGDRDALFLEGDWVAGETTGAPVFREALASIECRVSDRLRIGDHTLVIADVSAALVGVGATSPLVHFRGHLLEGSKTRSPELDGRAAYEDI
jgi:flavin reductase